MAKVFVKQAELNLVNGGYLVATKGKEENAVYNEEFVVAQKHAEYIIVLADKANGKDFVGKEADKISDVIAEAKKALEEGDKKFVEVPDAPKADIGDKLKTEALAFLTHDKDKTKAESVNAFLQKFKVVSEFEEFGLYFSDEKIVKLNKIYKMDEIIRAATAVIDLV